VKNYPMRTAPGTNPEAKELQEKNAVSAIFGVSVVNCALAFCCSGPRAAQTFDKTGIGNYWACLFAMSTCPWCTLMYTNGCTDLNEKLGGSKANCCAAALGSCCCACCVIAQDAESLDLNLGVKTGCCSVTQRSGEPFRPLNQ